VRPRAIPLLLLVAAAPALAGDAPPESDPFLAALAGKSGPDAVAAPSFDPDLAAVSWTTRPRRDIVDALAARLLRGEAKGWFEPAKETPTLAAPPSRIPADFEAGKFEVVDRLAARVPADTAVAFFGSLREAEDAVDGLSKFLPEALPDLCGDPPGGKRDALRRAIEMLLLPTIWRSNPGVRTGTRQIAVVASDPDLRWAPDIALVAEVDDASLVRFYRQSTISWEDRGRRRYRVDGLDVVADDGSVRSFFALEGDVAVWATTKSLRDRIVAAAAGKAPTLLSPDPRAYALARRTFPAKEGGALLVVPDAFLARVNAGEFRARHAAALRCEAARLVRDAMSRAAVPVPAWGIPTSLCETLHLYSMGRGSSRCDRHGTAACPVPASAVPDGPMVAADAAGLTALGAASDPILDGSIPIALRLRLSRNRFERLDVLVAPGKAGWRAVQVVECCSRLPGGKPSTLDAMARALAERGGEPGDIEALTGLLLMEPSPPRGKGLRMETRSTSRSRVGFAWFIPCGGPPGEPRWLEVIPSQLSVPPSSGGVFHIDPLVSPWLVDLGLSDHRWGGVKTGFRAFLRWR
jgi:hypothetical protein